MTPYQRLKLLIEEYRRVYEYNSYREAINSIIADLKDIRKDVNHVLVK